MPMIADFFQGPFAVDFLFQPAQGLINRFTFFKFNFRQFNSLPLRDREMQARMASPCSGRALESKSQPMGCQRPKTQERGLQNAMFPAHRFFMGLPDKPVTLST